MNVGCPQCTSVFRVDPAKVPAGGVRARCSVCNGVIHVPEPSMEEPVTATGAGWTGTASPEWGRVNTPEGGWTPPPPGAAGPPASPQAAPAADYTPPQPAPQSPAWETPAKPAAGGWSDWQAQGSPFGNSPQASPASEPSAVDPWGGFTGNPLTPEMPTPPYASARAETPAYPEPPASYEPPAAAATADGESEVEAAAGPGAEAVAGADRSQPIEQPQEYAGAESAGETQQDTFAEDRASRSGQQVKPAADEAHVNPFLKRDPHERARRLARALASDIVVYYPDKHAEGLRDGNLRELFREEIKKSYDDYVAQVGADLASSTTYFQDALNEVLAGGKRLF